MWQFRTRIRRDPESGAAQASLAEALQATHDAAGGAAALAEAERLNKVKADGQAAVFAVNAGLESLKRHEVAAAIARFREAVRLAPGNAQAHLQLALALRRSGALGESRRELEAARRLAPHSAPPVPQP